MIDKDELLIELYKQGIDLSIYKVNNEKFTVELKTINGDIIGVSSRKTPEQALATAIKRISEDSIAYKISNTNEGLSVL